MADASPPSLPPGMNEDKSWVAIFTVVLCLTVATFMVGLRIYTRAFITKQLGADDYAAVFTLVGLCRLPPLAVGTENAERGGSSLWCTRMASSSPSVSRT